MTTSLPISTCPPVRRAMVSAGGDRPRLTATSFDNSARRCEILYLSAARTQKLKRSAALPRKAFTSLKLERSLQRAGH